MAEDAMVRLGASPVGSIKVGDTKMPVVDPHGVQVVTADLIIERRELHGVCALSFATLVVTPNAEGPRTLEAVVCARLRLPLPVAINLRNALDQMLKQAMPPKGETH
jgi:hypothetical protein